MRIIAIELVNHVVLGNIKCDTLGSDINSIIGRNGSGKSLLMSCLHPYSTSSRLDFVYPIKSGMSGYKRIVYSDGMVTYEVMHEYTPKGDRHSCKSYINRLADGKIEELNPTGHNDMFKAMVKKHLHYDGDTATVCYISANNNGLVSSSSKRRREIMTTIIESDKLTFMTKNVSELVRDTTAALKILEGSKTQLLSVNGWKDRNSLNLDIVDEQLKVSELKIQEIERGLDNVNNALESLGKLDTDKLPILNLLTEVVDNKVFDVVAKYNDMVSSSKLYQKYVSDLTDRITNIKEKQSLTNKTHFIETEITKYMDDAKRLEDIITPKFVKKPDVGTIHIINSICDAISKIQELKKKLTLTLHDSIAIENDNIVEKIDELKSKISMYETIKDDVVYVPDRSEFSKAGDVCDSCVLYSKFYKNAEYVKDKENEYITAKEEVNVLSFNKEILDRILSIGTASLDASIRDTFTSEFIDEVGLNIMSDTNLVEIKTSLCENIERLYQIYDKLKELRIQLNSIIVEETTNYDEELLDAERNLEIYKSKYIEASEFLKSIYFHEERFNCKISDTPTEFMDYTKEQVISTRDTVRTYNTTLKSYLDKRDVLNNALSEETSNRKRLHDDLIKYKVALERIDEIENELNAKLLDKQIFLNCKELLTKDVPIYLLSSVISFIVTSVNTILMNHKIGLSIDIEITEDNDIIIPVYTERSQVPDVSSVSSGESCLISLLINAAMVHLLGYPILYIDEIDANLDEPNRVLFSKIVVSILSVFKIDQIFCISHNISSDIITSTKYLIGDGDGLIIGDDVTRL
jgi:tetratricopeptide (TPR) repeat protein